MALVIGRSHNGPHHRFVALHEVDNILGCIAAVVQIRIPDAHRFLFQERIQALVHPRPLALITVDDHGEVIVTNFVHDDVHTAHQHPVTDRSVFGRPATVKGNHGVLHASAYPVDGVSRGIRVRNGALGVNIQRVLNCQGRFLAPQGIAFFRVKGLSQRGFIGISHRHSIPDKFSG